jgi:hypothetical protein
MESLYSNSLFLKPDRFKLMPAGAQFFVYIELRFDINAYNFYYYTVIARREGDAAIPPQYFSGHAAC